MVLPVFFQSRSIRYSESGTLWIMLGAFWCDALFVSFLVTCSCGLATVCARVARMDVVAGGKMQLLLKGLLASLPEVLPFLYKVPLPLRVARRFWFAAFVFGTVFLGQTGSPRTFPITCTLRSIVLDTHS